MNSFSAPLFYLLIQNSSGPPFWDFQNLTIITITITTITIIIVMTTMTTTTTTIIIIIIIVLDNTLIYLK